MSAGTISREEINQLPIRRYEGPVHVVSAPEELAQAMADLRQESVLGFDTETRPAFRAGESYPPALAQLATARAVYLLRLQRLDCSAALRELLSSERIVKAGVGLAEDLRHLRKTFPFAEKAVVDLGAAARAHGLERSGVRTLAAVYLGFRIPKGAKTSNWAAARLTPQQVAYAAMDAWACRELYLKLKALGILRPA
ncbi:MAG TPA: 3'-5' exonuclease [Burkholderiales bacterium]